jgi:hypothetical protein
LEKKIDRAHFSLELATFIILPLKKHYAMDNHLIGLCAALQHDMELQTLISYMVINKKEDEFFALISSPDIVMKNELLVLAFEQSLIRENMLFAIRIWKNHLNSSNFAIANICTCITRSFSNSPFLLEHKLFFLDRFLKKMNYK